MGTQIKVPQVQQLLTSLVEKRGKEGVNFLKIGGLAGLFGKVVEWNIGMVHNCGINAHMWNMGIIVLI